MVGNDGVGRVDVLGLRECTANEIKLLNSNWDEKKLKEIYIGPPTTSFAVPGIGSLTFELNSVALDKLNKPVYACTDCSRPVLKAIFTLGTCSKRRYIRKIYFVVAQYVTRYKVTQLPPVTKPVLGDIGITIEGNLYVKLIHRKQVLELALDCP